MAQRLLHSKAPQCAEADGNATTASARFNRLGIRLVVKMPGLDATVFSPPPRERATSYAGRLMIAAALAVILLFSLQVDETKMLLAIGGVGALLVIVYGLPFVTRHRDWLICAFVLVLLINGMSFLDPTARVFFHYGALVLLCFPVIGTAVRSGIFRSGGFRLFTIYFLWAAFTITYSLAPEYSLARLTEALLILAALAAIVLDVREANGPTRLLSHLLVGAGIVLVLNAVGALILPHSITWQSPFESYTPDQLERMQKLGLSPDGLDRFRGLLGGPNDLGGLMLIVVGPALVCWRSASRRQRALLVAMIGGGGVTGGARRFAISVSRAGDWRRALLGMEVAGARGLGIGDSRRGARCSSHHLFAR